jgi:hypothetical protein
LQAYFPITYTAKFPHISAILYRIEPYFKSIGNRTE